MKITYETEEINKVIQLLTEGLQIDGAHHKQWYMHKALSILDEEGAKQVEEWTEDIGRAP